MDIRKQRITRNGSFLGSIHNRRGVLSGRILQIIEKRYTCSPSHLEQFKFDPVRKHASGDVPGYAAQDRHTHIDVPTQWLRTPPEAGPMVSPGCSSASQIYLHDNWRTCQLRAPLWTAVGRHTTRIEKVNLVDFCCRTTSRSNTRPPKPPDH